jgi:hypothetical protein
MLRTILSGRNCLCEGAQQLKQSQVNKEETASPSVAARSNDFLEASKGRGNLLNFH